MTPNTSLASTIALRDQLNASYQLYQASKPQFQLPVVLQMLAGVASICIRRYGSQNISTNMKPYAEQDRQVRGPCNLHRPQHYEPIFTIRQEYNNYNNSDKGITDPTGFKEVREYLKKVQVICDAVDAQKQGAADVATALADVKPKVHILISPPDLIMSPYEFMSKTHSLSTEDLGKFFID